MRGILATISGAPEARALNSWKGFAMARRGRFDRMRSAVGALIHAEAARAMRTWQEAASMVTRARQLCNRIRYAGAMRALHTWKDKRDADNEAKRIRMWTARRFAGDPRAVIIDTWRRRTSELNTIGRRIALFLPDRRAIFVAWNMWRGEADKRRHEKGMAARWLLAPSSSVQYLLCSSTQVFNMRSACTMRFSDLLCG